MSDDKDPQRISDAADNCEVLRARLAKYEDAEGLSFQGRVMPWLLECFGAAIASDTVERNHRFLEEALELVQACGCPADEAHKLVDYVYGREVGEKSQEVGGVMVTLAALCLAQGLDMHLAGETELARITQPAMVERIRDKQKRKPAMSPLPGSYPERAALTASAPSHGEQVREVVFSIPKKKDLTHVGGQGADVGYGWNLCVDAINEGAQPFLEWCVERWHAEVSQRPLFNVHRRSIDDTWRQVIRKLGGDPVDLCGPDHSTLLAAAPSAGSQKEQGE